jgi:hypothetical protein
VLAALRAPFGAVSSGRGLLVEYKPALRLESAAVRTTKFMIDAAVIPTWGLPRWEKNVTNGDSPAL